MARDGRPTPGDFTGKEKHRQGRESAQAQVERGAEMSMATSAQEAEERHGVFDPRTGHLIENGGPGPHDAVLVDDDLDEDIDDDLTERARFGGSFPTTVDDEPVFTGQESPEEIEPALAARRKFKPPRHNIAQDPFVKIRVDQDVEDMTYGMINGEPRNLTFREGLTYSVPREVAEHLNERDLVRQWM